MACVRRGWVAVSQLRGADAPARRTLAPRHVAHREPPGHLGRSGTAGQPRRFRLSRRTPLWVRSRATRARLVPAIRSGLGRHSAVRPEQNRRQRPVRGYSYASQPPAVRSEGRWIHLSVPYPVIDEDLAHVFCRESASVLYAVRWGTFPPATTESQCNALGWSAS